MTRELGRLKTAAFHASTPLVALLAFAFRPLAMVRLTARVWREARRDGTP